MAAVKTESCTGESALLDEPLALELAAEVRDNISSKRAGERAGGRQTRDARLGTLKTCVFSSLVRHVGHCAADKSPTSAGAEDEGNQPTRSK